MIIIYFDLLFQQRNLITGLIMTTLPGT